MRKDKRQNHELRNIEFICNYTKYAEGSVLVKFGDTHVLCNASLINKVPNHAKDNNHGWLTAEYNMLPRATHVRNDREATKGKLTGRTQEIQRLIGRSLRLAIDLKEISGYTIHIDCDVIQADGGTRTASITGAWLALVHAVKYMQAQNLISYFPKIKQIAAISIGIINNSVLVDLDYQEDSSCDTDLNLVMDNNSGIIEVQGTAEGQSFTKFELDKMLEIGSKSIKKIFELQNIHI